MAEGQRIILGGRHLQLIGEVQRQPVSEWATGLRLGAPSRDNRSHASFWDMSDWRGGVGIEYMDPQEDQGRFWDSEDGADTRWPQRLILPPLFTSEATITNQPDNAPTRLVYFAGDCWFSTGKDELRRRNSGSWTAEALPVTGDINDIIVFRPSGGTDHIVALVNKRPYKSTTGLAASWTDISGAVDRGTRMEVYDDKLICFLDDGKVYYTLDLSTWTQVGPVGDTSAPFNIGHAEATLVFPTATGEPMTYILDEHAPGGEEGLFVFDFFSGRITPTDSGIRPLRDTTSKFSAFPHMSTFGDGRMLISRGSELFSYRPGDTRHLGPNRRSEHGLPADMVRGLGRFAVTSLYAFVPLGSLNNIVSTEKSALLCYDGTGWSVLYRTAANKVIVCAYVCAGATGVDLFILEATPNASNWDYEIYRSVLPPDGINPLTFGQSFATTGSHITPWFNGGFAEIPGIALSMAIIGRDITDDEAVKIEYQVDGKTDTWTVLGEFTEDSQEIFFPRQTVLNNPETEVGKAFKIIRFRITLSRAVATATNTPIVESLIFQFLKRPPLRYQYSFVVNVDASATDEWSREDVIAFIEGLYDEQKLNHFKEGPLNAWTTFVTLPAIDLVEDEESGTEGRRTTINLQLIEPVAGLRWVE